MNVPSPHPNGDWLDALLREDARGYIDDSGFTDRVTAALPVRHRFSLNGSARQLWPLAMTVLACGIAFAVIPDARFIFESLADTGSLSLAPSATLALAVTIGVLYWISIAGALDEK
jgi:hypothetical protein